MSYTPRINETVLNIKPSGIRKYFDLLDDNCISLGVGEPDFPTPDSIRHAAAENIYHNRIPYTANAGMPKLRQLILDYISERFGMDGYEIQNTLITIGAGHAADLAFRVAINPGDEVIYTTPTYVTYDPGIRLCGGIPVPVVTDAEHHFKLTPDVLRAAITPKTKVLLLAYPTNPTGGIMEREDLEAIADVIRDTDITIISDEIYAELTYNGKRHVSISSLPGMQERTIVLNGFSKSFSMTGWRLGFAVGPVEYISMMTKIHQLTVLCAPTTAQIAGCYALEQGFETGWADVNAMIAEYDARRKYLVDAFNSLGLTCANPEGAFYVFPSIESTGLSCTQFCEQLLERKKVLVIPGDAFGESGKMHVRACYATSMDDLKEAVSRISDFLDELKSGK